MEQEETPGSGVILFNSKTTEYSWLSNFSAHPVKGADGLWWPTAEHAYQACKTFDPEIHEELRTLPHAWQVKKRAKSIHVRKSWTVAVKLSAMLAITRAKFNLHTKLADALVATGDQQLVHFCPWGDSFWGVDRTYQGQNHQGLILMAVRLELQGQ